MAFIFAIIGFLLFFLVIGGIFAVLVFVVWVVLSSIGTGYNLKVPEYLYMILAVVVVVLFLWKGL